MILVSTRFPEEIPWFKAWRRVAVAAISAGDLGGRLSLSVVFRVFMRCGRSAVSNYTPVHVRYLGEIELWIPAEVSDSEGADIGRY